MSPQHPLPHPTDPAARRTLRRLAGFLTLLGVLWIAFYVLWQGLPYVRPGHEQIYALQERMVEDGELFAADAPVRVVLFGDSRVQAGFKPAYFDELSGGRVSSYNLGLPDERNFMPELEVLVRRVPPPTDLLLTVPWSVDPAPRPWDRLLDDSALVGILFPFRRLPRDLVLFFLRSLSRGGPAAYYRQGRTQIELARSERGYFFIEGMSHFPGHRLPEDFRLDADDATREEIRQVELRGPAFERLQALREELGFRVWFVPTYWRLGSFAPSRGQEATRARLAERGIGVLGPDHWLYPNAYFSDPVHLNREGADAYTRDLWDLVRSALERAGHLARAE